MAWSPDYELFHAAGQVYEAETQFARQFAEVESLLKAGQDTTEAERELKRLEKVVDLVRAYYDRLAEEPLRET